jgi:hypothetical protein
VVKKESIDRISRENLKSRQNNEGIESVGQDF